MPASLIERGPDGGPIYTETDFTQVIVEPYNALSALLFIGLSLYWLIRLKFDFKRYTFLCSCLLLMLIGGIGGSLFHAFRQSGFFLKMDWMPIMIICVMVSIYFLYQVLRKWLLVVLCFGLIIGLQALFWTVIGRDNHHLAITINYGFMGLAILGPIVWYLYSFGYEYARYVWMALASFALALLFRLIDVEGYLPMGTHFLWHIFGALAGNFMIAFLYFRQRMVE